MDRTIMFVAEDSPLKVVGLLAFAFGAAYALHLLGGVARFLFEGLALFAS